MDLENEPLRFYPSRMILATLILAALPIISDNYPRARQEAIRRDVPMFVDVWAPW